MSEIIPSNEAPHGNLLARKGCCVTQAPTLRTAVVWDPQNERWPRRIPGLCGVAAAPPPVPAKSSWL